MNTLLAERGLPATGAYVTSPAATSSSQSAVSWAAIICGAVVAAAVSLILLALGSAWGLSALSPWSAGPSVTAFSLVAALWLVITQWVAAGFGGYLTGRLRTQWVATHTHEVFFRDTAHGFVAWALATLLTAALAATAATSLASGAAQVAGTAGVAAAAGTNRGAATGSYDLDVLLRGSGAENAAAGAGDPRAEVMRIVANGLSGGAGVAAEDRAYLASVVSARTGVTPAEAQARVDTFIARTKAAMDSARKAAAAFALFTAVSMLIGAFIACVAAALGGGRRDLNAGVMADGSSIR
ncbi:MAG TPA: hypothetical protein VGI91_05390 [Steroidobacteraceae bacterium]|jgi:hypothetical protein